MWKCPPERFRNGGVLGLADCGPDRMATGLPRGAEMGATLEERKESHI